MADRHASPGEVNAMISQAFFRQHLPKEAIQEATRNGSDVVLVDTAGRMQSEEGVLAVAGGAEYVGWCGGLGGDVASMLDELLKSKVIALPEMKRPEESGKVDDPNYCKYHRLVSHPVEKCFVLKDKIMDLEGLIEFEVEVASSNVASITRVIPEYEVLTMAIKFGSFDPIILPVASTKLATSQQIGGSHFSETNEDEDNDGWTLVTRHRAKKNHPKCVKVLETQKKAHQLISKPK
ncbi:hypothetical protein COLO4_20280 [Corchorus olitorius]|uniref:SRP54-type proteins GTP-binding domain-containing protein n=1 Tax=Corchorus olitorius TaxID=93759 RepID=A0A1R3J0R1_9ROSI|nr:hypothetical protein COLO4_20280 [Corchorus olitorius]